MVNHGFFNLCPTLLYDFYGQNGWEIELLVGREAMGRGASFSLDPIGRAPVPAECVIHCLARRTTDGPLVIPGAGEIPPMIDHDAKPGPLSRCQITGSEAIELVIDLGHQPPCDALLRPEQLLQPEETFPLRLMFCPGSGLAQLDYVAPGAAGVPAGISIPRRDLLAGGAGTDRARRGLHRRGLCRRGRAGGRRRPATTARYSRRSSDAVAASSASSRPMLPD
jgi:hypothetical protein